MDQVHVGMPGGGLDERAVVLGVLVLVDRLDDQRRALPGSEGARERIDQPERVLAREHAVVVEREQEQVQAFEEEWEDDSWLNAAGPVHKRPPEKKPERSNNQFFSHRRSLPSIDQKRPNIGR